MRRSRTTKRRCRVVQNDTPPSQADKHLYTPTNGLCTPTNAPASQAFVHADKTVCARRKTAERAILRLLKTVRRSNTVGASSRLPLGVPSHLPSPLPCPPRARVPSATNICTHRQTVCARAFAGVSRSICLATHVPVFSATVATTKDSSFFATTAISRCMLTAWASPAQSKAIGYAVNVRTSRRTPKATRAERKLRRAPEAKGDERGRGRGLHRASPCASPCLTVEKRYSGNRLRASKLS